MSPLDLLYKELTMSSLISRSNLLDDFFKDFAPGFFVKPLQSEALPSPGQIRMDIKESGEAYTIEAEVPGVAKDAIHVSLDGNTVTVKAEVKKEESRSGESCLRSERYYGAVSRSLTLPANINSEKAKAHYDQGVLTLTLPKSSPGTTRELTIQ
jgi:HSP20 family protein